jgi:hypothetical protein
MEISFSQATSQLLSADLLVDGVEPIKRHLESHAASFHHCNCLTTFGHPIHPILCLNLVAL